MSPWTHSESNTGKRRMASDSVRFLSSKFPFRDGVADFAHNKSGHESEINLTIEQICHDVVVGRAIFVGHLLYKTNLS